MTFPLGVLPFWFARSRDDSARAASAGRSHTPAGVAPSVPGDDADVVARVCAGDVAAFEALFFAHAEGLVTFAAGYAKSRSAAEDVVADVFANIWERRTTWKPVHGVRAYLYASARNRALNTVRDQASHARLAVLPDVGPVAERLPDEQLVIDEQIAIVRRAIETFPEPRRHMMELRWRDGLSAVEIASVLGVTRNAVDIQLTRALQALRVLLPDLLR